jgi:hypothetical protein
MARLAEPADIVALMAEDMRERHALAGCVVAEDLTLIGWTARQIADHAPAAADRARRRAIKHNPA